MTTVGEVRATSGVDLGEPVSAAGDGQEARSVALIEEIGGLGQVAPGTFGVLTDRATAETGWYRLEVGLRRASERGLVALAMPGMAAVPSTTIALAERGRITLLDVAATRSVGDVLISLERAMGGGAPQALADAERALEALDAIRSDPSAAAKDAVRVLGRFAPGLELRDPAEGDLSAPVVVDGIVQHHLCAHARGGPADVATRIVLELGSARLAAIATAARRAEEVPIRSASELLTELLAAEPGRTARLLNRARTLGLVVDGWHVVARLEIDDPANDAEPPLELQETLGTLALRTARASGGAWHLGRSESALVLIRMHETDPGSVGVEVERTLERVVAEVGRHVPGRMVRAGIGSVHAGATGLRASAAEARAALGAARVADRREPVARFDPAGLQRMLLEWYASDTARESVETLLGPLERLGPRRSETAIRTLQAYLDEQGSVVRTARALFLHRNAVAYRIRRIQEQLGVDLSDPDQRLALQLACRARMLPSPRLRSAHPASSP